MWSVHDVNTVHRYLPQAQQQTTPLTTADKLRAKDDILYIACDDTGGTLQGFLRLGRKYLFLYPVSVRNIEFAPKRRVATYFSTVFPAGRHVTAFIWCTHHEQARSKQRSHDIKFET